MQIGDLERRRARLYRLFVALVTDNRVSLRDLARKLPLDPELLLALPGPAAADADLGFALAGLIISQGIDTDAVCETLRLAIPSASLTITRTQDSFLSEEEQQDPQGLALVRMLRRLGHSAPLRLLGELMGLPEATIRAAACRMAERVELQAEQAELRSPARALSQPDAELHRRAAAWYARALDGLPAGPESAMQLTALIHHQVGAGDWYAAVRTFARLRREAVVALEDAALRPALERLCDPEVPIDSGTRQQVSLLMARVLAEQGLWDRATNLLYSALSLRGDDTPGVCAELAMISLACGEPSRALKFASLATSHRQGASALPHPPLRALVARARWELGYQEGLHAATLGVELESGAGPQRARGVLLLVEPLLDAGRAEQASRFAESARLVACEERSFTLARDALLALARVAPTPERKGLLGGLAKLRPADSLLRAGRILLERPGPGLAQAIEAAILPIDVPLTLKMELSLMLASCQLESGDNEKAFKRADEIARVCRVCRAKRMEGRADALRQRAWAALGRSGPLPQLLVDQFLPDPTDVPQLPDRWVESTPPDS